MEKRYEYWAFEDGKAIKKFSKWFKYNGEKYHWQLKGKLKNEYRESS